MFKNEYSIFISYSFYFLLDTFSLTTHIIEGSENVKEKDEQVRFYVFIFPVF